MHWSIRVGFRPPLLGTVGNMNYFSGMDTAFDTAATVRELEATGMDRGLAEVVG